MNDTINTIKTRRSIRSYKDNPINKKILEELVDCARLAPTGRNIQPWEFIVITDKGKLKQLGQIATTGPFIADAAACIVVCGPKDQKWVFEDGSAAVENILLAAHSLGIASCWVAGYPKEYCTEINKLLGIPDSHVVVASLPLGYPAVPNPTKVKRALKEVIHWESF